METTNKTGLTRMIISKLFCHHQYREIYRIEFKNKSDQVVSISAARECTECGRTKKLTL